MRVSAIAATEEALTRYGEAMEGLKEAMEQQVVRIVGCRLLEITEESKVPQHIQEGSRLRCFLWVFI